MGMYSEGQYGESYRDGMPEILDMPEGYVQRYNAEQEPDSSDAQRQADNGDREMQP